MYAVQSGHVVSAALGYFIYPICTVLLGIAVLGERLDRWAAGHFLCDHWGAGKGLSHRWRALGRLIGSGNIFAVCGGA